MECVDFIPPRLIDYIFSQRNIRPQISTPSNEISTRPPTYTQYPTLARAARNFIKNHFHANIRGCTKASDARPSITEINEESSPV